MELNTVQNFWQKGIYSPFWILASRGKKKKNQKALTHPMKKLAFWISLFQSSWHFAFYLPWGIKRSLYLGSQK
jgi:hypothetical protein